MDLFLSHDINLKANVSGNIIIETLFFLNDTNIAAKAFCQLELSKTWVHTYSYDDNKYSIYTNSTLLDKKMIMKAFIIQIHF